VSEFESDAFKNKNIRVRPNSSTSNGRHLGDDKSEHQSRYMHGSDGENEGDDRKYNTDVMLEMTMMRKTQKDFLLE
jgi:hypothetical protein